MQDSIYEMLLAFIFDETTKHFSFFGSNGLFMGDID